ncbi:MAG: hypothetical protein A2W25_02320 [candidate division Zixibacteria bacterium RBG_16_53_22]|nr:MAG: hypothetical protein A2W25_02320 [candidate division Zixibacteria bacterium RBG_16_53_22]
MHKFSAAGLAVILLIFGLATSARSDVEFGLSADDGGLREFHLAVGDFYRVPEKEVVVVRERRIPDEELPVVFFLASRARVGPGVIVGLRLDGRSWMDIALYYGLGADIFYVDARADGPPYGRALGYYKNKPKKEWKYIRLADDDIVNLVNLSFISKHYGYSPNTVIKMRSQGKGFIAINSDAKHGKIGKESKGGVKQAKAKEGPKGKSKSKGESKSKRR